jgi:hypothetical protein
VGCATLYVTVSRRFTAFHSLDGELIARQVHYLFMTLTKSPIGIEAFNARTGQIPSRLRPAFIMFDGIKTTEQILSVTIKLGITRSDIEQMARDGLLVEIHAANDAVNTPEVELNQSPHDLREWGNAKPVAKPISNATPQERYAKAMPLATKVSSKLGLKGFMLNMAIERASGYDELLAVLPKLQAAAGHEACKELEAALKG